MGFVFEAWQLSLQRVVALKVLAGMVSLTETSIQRFQREAQAAAKLHHTNIVPIYAQGDHEGVYYYAMELVNGRSLHAIIEEARRGRSSDLGLTETRPMSGSGSTSGTGWGSDGTEEGSGVSLGTGGGTGPAPGASAGAATWQHVLSPTTVEHFDTMARLIATVAEALEYAHQAGVIHRDIKPHNLILGGDGRLCITDFGLARLLEQPAVTMTGEFLGSPLYMSPEQISGAAGQVDHRTDVYSLGATLYEWLTLRPPFPGQNREQVISRIMSGDATAPRSVDPRIPVDLETICLKAIEKEPSKRYQTAGDMAADLRRFLERNAIFARRAGLVRQAKKFVVRHQVGVLGSMLIAVILLFGGALLKAHLQSRGKAQPDDTGIGQQGVAIVPAPQDQSMAAGRTAELNTAPETPVPLPQLRTLASRSREPITDDLAQDPYARGEQVAQQLLQYFGDDEPIESNLADQLDEFKDEVSRRLADDLLAAQLEALRALVDGAAPDAAVGPADESFFRAMAATAAGDTDQALEWVDRAFAEDADHERALALKTALRCRQGQITEMKQEATRLVAVNDQSAEAQVLLGAAHLLLGEADPARARFDRAAQLGEASAWLFVLQGLAHARANNLLDAMRAYNQAVKLEPDHVVARLAHGKAHYYMGSFEEALRDADLLVELLPASSAAYVFRAECHDKLLEFQQSVKDYTKAIELGGTSMTLVGRLAWAMANVEKQQVSTRSAEALAGEEAGSEVERAEEHPPSEAQRENVNWLDDWIRQNLSGPDSASSPPRPSPSYRPFGFLRT